MALKKVIVNNSFLGVKTIQTSIHGNIVNFPSNVNFTVQCLSRLITESQTIPIKLKRRLSYKHHYQFQSI